MIPLRIKLCLIGQAGSGKTFLIGTLLNAGYSVRLYDFDGNALIIKSAAKDLSRLEMTSYNHRDGATWTAIKREGDAIIKRPSSDIVVFDSLSHLSEAVLKAGMAKFPSNSYDAYEFVIEEMKDFLAKLSAQAQCHLIFNCHGRYMEDDRSVRRFMPSLVGQGLPFALAKQMNNVWLIDTEKERTIRTKSTSMSDLKCSDLSLAPNEPFDLGKLFTKMKVPP